MMMMIKKTSKETKESHFVSVGNRVWWRNASSFWV